MRREPTWHEPVALLVLLAICAGIGACYGQVMHGNWKCGMPGVHCRIEVKP